MDIFEKYETKKPSTTERKKIVSFNVKRNLGGSGRFAVITVEDNGDLGEVLVDERYFESLRPYIEEWESNKNANLPVYREGDTLKFSHKAALDDEIERLFTSPKEDDEFVRIQSYVTRHFRNKLEAKYGKDKIGAVIRHALCEYMGEVW